MTSRSKGVKVLFRLSCMLALWSVVQGESEHESWQTWVAGVPSYLT